MPYSTLHTVQYDTIQYLYSKYIYINQNKAYKYFIVLFKDGFKQMENGKDYQCRLLLILLDLTWDDSICFFRFPFVVALYSHILQRYLALPWTDSI